MKKLMTKNEADRVEAHGFPLTRIVEWLYDGWDDEPTEVGLYEISEEAWNWSRATTFEHQLFLAWG